MGPIKYFPIFLLILVACKEPEQLHHQFSIPSPGKNLTSLEGIELGKKIFFFESENKSGKMSCASCHKPDSGFSSASMRFINGVKRQVPSLYNLAFSQRFMWDGREKNLESLVIKPLANHEEMDQNLQEMIFKMNQNQELKDEFNLVFGSDSIYTALVSRALAQYMRSLIKLVPDQNTRAGKILFENHCVNCHKGKFSSDFGLRYSVVAASGPDSGKFRISGKPIDIFTFKTPSLAKIRLTSPYMHDGRYRNLNEVVVAYSKILKIKELKSVQAQYTLVKFLEQL